jgi:small subunit ribosomal protein S4
MARYRGPKAKVARRFNDPIFGPSKAVQKKAYPPGQHGRSRRRKPSEYAIQLMEKQKAKYTYGVLERQFSNLFDKASRKSGITGEILLQLLETRLDNTVFRLGIAPTRRAARQFVLHKHITVNGKVVNIPSYALKIGDVIEVREKSKSLEVVVNSVAATATKRFPWLEWSPETLTGKLISLPIREDIPENIQEQLIVELYSK